jgi:hypothetical protein
MNSTAIPMPWRGECNIFWTIPELKALGLSRKQIEHDVFTRRVMW